LLLEDSGENRLHHPQQNRLEDTKKHLVVGLLELHAKVFDANIDLFHLEESSAVLLVGGGKLKLEVESISPKKYIGHADIGNRREALLLLDVITNICRRI
jgi:hypothetical protein